MFFVAVFSLWISKHNESANCEVLDNKGSVKAYAIFKSGESIHINHRESKKLLVPLFEKNCFCYINPNTFCIFSSWPDYLS